MNFLELLEFKNHLTSMSIVTEYVKVVSLYLKNCKFQMEQNSKSNAKSNLPVNKKYHKWSDYNVYK